MEKELSLQELQKYYDNAFEMMATKGWSDFMEDIDRVKNSYDKLSSVTETHTLDFRRGQMDILNWLSGLKSSYEKTFEQIKEEAAHG